MSLSKSNVLVVYRQGDSDSQSFANRYKSIRNLDDDQVISIPCSNIEILDSYNGFKNEVENPIKNALGSSPVSNYNIYAIVLCPFVPGGFRDGNDIISSTSRLSRINSVFEKNIKNDLYDRRVPSSFSSEEAEYSIICTRFDAPTYEIANRWLYNIEKAIKRIIVNGDFYLDAYSGFYGGGYSEYTEDLLKFEQYFIPLTGNGLVSSKFIDPYIDSIIPYIQDDSFFWGWGSERGSLSFFKNSSHIRCFFYNADMNGSFTMRDIDERNWPVLSIRNGYVSTAGSMSDPGPDGYLRPRPFIDSLLRGYSLGEAFLYSQPYLDWTVSCFGDPLLVFKFPKELDNSSLIEENIAWQLMEEEISKSIATINRKSNIIENLRDIIMNGSDTELALDFLYQVEELYYLYNDKSRKNDFINLVQSVIEMATDRNRFTFESYYPSFNDYLSQTENKVSELFADSIQDDILLDSISESNKFKNGSWKYEFVLDHIYSRYTNYHFEIDISEDSNFSNIIYSIKSYEDSTGWFFEEYDNIYSDIKTTGVPSSYAGKRIKFYNEEYLLERSNRYYIRYRQKYLSNFGSYKYDFFIVYN